MHLTLQLRLHDHTRSFIGAHLLSSIPENSHLNISDVWFTRKTSSSYYSVLVTSKRLNSQKSTLFGSLREEKTEQTIAPNIGETEEYRDIAYLRRHSEETTSRISIQVGKLDVKLTNCQKLSVDKSGVNFQEFDQILKVNTERKSPDASGRERGEGTMLKNTGAFYSS